MKLLEQYQDHHLRAGRSSLYRVALPNLLGRGTRRLVSLRKPAVYIGRLKACAPRGRSILDLCIDSAQACNQLNAMLVGGVEIRHAALL